MIDIIEPKFFFKQKINEYFTQQKIRVEKDTEHYLIDILSKYIAADQIKYSTLFEIYEKCVYENKIEHYAYLGEHSLYMAGMFPGSITKSLVNIDYYVNMGSLGFEQASKMSLSKTNRKIYKDLAIGFKHYMNSFYLISKDSLFKDTLSMHVHYLQTENPALLQDLLNIRSKS